MAELCVAEYTSLMLDVVCRYSYRVSGRRSYMKISGSVEPRPLTVIHWYDELKVMVALLRNTMLYMPLLNE